MATEQGWRQVSARSPLADPHPSLLPQHDAERVRRLAKDLLVLRQQRSGCCQPFQRRAAEYLTFRHRKDTTDVDQRAKRAVLQAKDRNMFSGTVHDGVLKKRQRRKACQAVVGEHVQEVSIDGVGQRGLDLLPERASAMDWSDIEQRTRARHLVHDGIADPIAITRFPFVDARDVKAWLERQRTRKVVAFMSRLQILVVGVTIALNALDGFDILSISFASPGIATEWGIDRAALGIVLSMELIGMERLSSDACASYRRIVTDDPSFLDYFRASTPQAELEDVNIGSRPARREKGSGLDGLRAIPWQFAWTQTRLLLASWLGLEEALDRAFERGDGELLQTMYREWPHFRSAMDLFEMVLAKADARIAAEYDRQLVPDQLQPLGQELRDRLARAASALLRVTGHRYLLEGNQVLRRSIDVRNPYVDPINLVQIEVVRRLRQGDHDPRLHDAFVVTVNGIAAGMRNTG